MFISQSPSPGAVADEPVSSPTVEDVSAELDAAENPDLHIREEPAQHEWPYSYLFWKAALHKIADARVRSAD